MSVIFGTTLLAIALTSFAPAWMMPACSESRPTMKPLTSCRNRIGTRVWLQSMTNRAALSARIDVDHAAELERPRRPACTRFRWLATTPTGTPAEPAVAADERLAELGLVLVERAVVENARRAGRGRRTLPRLPVNERHSPRRAARRRASASTRRGSAGSIADQPAQALQARGVVRLAVVDGAADRRRASSRRRAPRGSTVWPIAAFTSAGPAR